MDRFYDGKIKDGVFSILGWSLIFGSIMLLSPCNGYEYGDGAKNMSDMNINPLIIAPLILGIYGGILVLRKGFRLLRQFENSES